MRTAIQALAYVAAEQAGLAVAPGQGQHIQGVEVITLPVFGDHPVLAQRLAGDSIDQLRQVTMGPGRVDGGVAVLTTEQFIG
ncbi:hypothetical protein D3C73_1520040 [compost metagenome]